ncbi:hypothetical protein ASH00_15330 [Arthrobacter sp. Soil782]|uniref:DUF2254 domain-containing protein n=1 Tax=Arthrobacter sp. Soil782 TaxID=1736410 RepID=UPI0006FC9B85|nr:DUF2254 domain-containing protein [Arthrobacter sp. Soil782]KRF04022.1 hypothetical protein ASH00_15330 [Arthrobacter sp. Soil782]
MERSRSVWHSATNLTPRMVRDYIRTQLWPVPLTAVIVSVVLAQYVTWLDHQLDDDMPPALSALLFGGGAAAARSLMEAIAASTITVTSLTFSLTVVTLQLASSQYSPRLLRTFTSDRFVHNTLALFLATFAYSLTVLRTIRDNDEESTGFVPEIAVTLSFLLSLTTVIGLVLFLGHLSRQLRVERMLADVHDDLSSTMGSVTGGSATPHIELEAPAGALDLPAGSSGFLVQVNEEALLKVARQFDVVIVLQRPPGDFLVEGVPYGYATQRGGGDWTEDRAQQLRQAVENCATIGFERNSVQDIGFPVQQILDVAVRAISPSVNDPTTCVHALGHLSAGLSSLAREDSGHRMMTDSEGHVRVTIRRRTLSMLLELVVSQICTYGMDDPRVARRLVDLMDETELNASGRHGEIFGQQRQRIARALSGSGLDPVDQQELLQRCATGA